MDSILHLREKFHCQIDNLSQLKEVVIHAQGLSQQTEITLNEVKNSTLFSTDCNFTTSLQIDLLFSEDQIKAAINHIKEILEEVCISSLRIKDLGLLTHFANHSNITLIWLADSHQYNSRSIITWLKSWDDRISRVVLSPQLPLDVIANIIDQSQAIDWELQVLGRLPLLITSRKIIDADNEFELVSDEPRERTFQTVVNNAGTTFYHHKDLFLLDKIELVEGAGITKASVDVPLMTFIEEQNTIHQILWQRNFSLGEKLRDRWPKSTTHGFSRTNKTEKPINRLKTVQTIARDEKLIGNVVEVVGGEYMLIKLNNDLVEGEQLKIVTPEGKEQIVTVNENTILKNSLSTRLLALKHEKSVTGQSLVYRLN